MAKPVQQIIANARQAALALAQIKQRAAGVDEQLIRVATDCMSLAITLEGSKSTLPCKQISKKLNEAFKDEHFYDDFIKMIYAMGADILSVYYVDSFVTMKANLPIEKNRALEPLHQAYKVQPTPKIDLATETELAGPSRVTPDSNESDDADVPVQNFEEFCMEDPVTPDTNTSNAPPPIEVEQKALIKEIQSAASTAYATIDKGHFFTFVITVFGFYWGHHAKLEALDKIIKDKNPSKAKLAEALNMHRFMPFWTCCRGETSSSSLNSIKTPENARQLP